MKIRLHNIALAHDANVERALPAAIAERAGTAARDIEEFTIVRRSIDARQRRVQLIFSVDVTLNTDAIDWAAVRAERTPEIDRPEIRSGSAPLPWRPVVIGAGPSGLFSALLLAEHGYRPIVLDRGGSVDQRIGAIKRFLGQRRPDPECNVLFGIGGAGTFSDGKLTTSLSHPWLRFVLEVLVDCGAPAQILIDAKPHIGTDLLCRVVARLVDRIERAGGEVRTGVRVDRFVQRDGRLVELTTSAGSLRTDIGVVAIGHSAPDTWRQLARSGVLLAPKPFQLGIRVEHPQQWVDRRQYGEAAGNPALGAAEYKLTTRVAGTPVFSFCMCPGGETIPTVNQSNRLALNGMSQHARDSAFSSSGVVVTLTPEVCGATDWESALAFRSRIEKRCFEAGGEDYTAPGQQLIQFASGQSSASALPRSSYRLGVVPTRLDEILPRCVSVPLRAALPVFDRKMPGFLHPQALALAPESRASSPLAIVRDKTTFESTTVSGIYPVGEGAGRAGGIMSCALDGLKAATRIIERHAPPG